MNKEEGTRSCNAIWGGGEAFEVDHLGRTYVVDLQNKTCGCNKWDLTGIPCPHAMCCIVKDRRRLDQFVHHYYTKEAYLMAYKEIIHPMPGESQWERTPHIHPAPPPYMVQPGRPKKLRRREAGEVPSSNKRIRIVGLVKCTNCGNPGHYKNKCSAPPRTNDNPPPTQQNRGRRPRSTKTVPIGSQKRRKYTKNVPQNQQGNPGSTPGGNQQGTASDGDCGSHGGQIVPSQGYAPSASHGEAPSASHGSNFSHQGNPSASHGITMSQGVCSQSNPKPFKSPRMKIPASKTKLVKEVPRRSPRKKTKK